MPLQQAWWALKFQGKGIATAPSRIRQRKTWKLEEVPRDEKPKRRSGGRPKKASTPCSTRPPEAPTIEVSVD